MEFVDMFLGVNDWPKFSRWADRRPVLSVDLRHLAYAYPPGVVGALLLARYRNDCGCQTYIRPPTNPDVLNYLERIDFFTSIEPYASFETDVAHLRGNQRNSAEHFTEILTPMGSGFTDAGEVIWRFLERHFPRIAATLYTPFQEVLTNIEDHSLLDAGRIAFNCVQVQIYQRWIELAFGDLGVGFRASLGSNPRLPRFGTEADALRAAIVDRSSRFTGEDRARGGGLRKALDVVHQLGGHARILTNNGIALQRSTDQQPRFQTASYTFPGTLVWMQIPSPSS